MELPVNYDEIPQYKRRLIREEYVKVQKGNCQFCGTPLDGEPDQQVAALCG